MSKNVRLNPNVLKSMKTLGFNHTFLKSAVFFEPIKLPKKKVLVLAEQQGIK